MNVLVIGGRGAMGRRYSAILRYLGHTPVVIDLPWPAVIPEWRYAINATSTENHLDAADQLIEATGSPRGRCVLMEKPVAKTLGQLHEIRNLFGGAGISMHSVNQYNYLPEVVKAPLRIGDHASWYRYYNSGRDGLHWDCFQIYALAEGKVDITNDSPLWDCGINGQRINIAHMDWAYIDMIEDWLGPQKRVWGWDVIERTTRKIREVA